METAIIIGAALATILGYLGLAPDGKRLLAKLREWTTAPRRRREEQRQREQYLVRELAVVQTRLEQLRHKQDYLFAQQSSTATAVKALQEQITTVDHKAFEMGHVVTALGDDVAKHDAAIDAQVAAIETRLVTLERELGEQVAGMQLPSQPSIEQTLQRIQTISHSPDGMPPSRR